MTLAVKLCVALMIAVAPTLVRATTQQANPEGDKPVILVVGDSLSAEYGLERGSGWVEKITEKLAQEGAEYQIQNSSISGDTTSGGLTRLPQALEAFKPAIVLIELGANDALRGLSLDMTRQNLNRMTEQALEAGAQVLLIGMQIPPNYGRRYTEEFKQVFGEVAEKNQVALVPFLLEGIATDPAYFQNDGIHPNEQAQPILANNVWAELQPLITR